MRVRIYEKSREYQDPNANKAHGEAMYEEQEVVTHEIQSNDKSVIAAFLRSIADSLNPQPRHKPGYRGEADKHL